MFRRHGAHVPSFIREDEWSAKVTVGAETAARLGVPIGTEVDLGTIAYYHRNPIRRWLGRRKIKRHALSD